MTDSRKRAGIVDVEPVLCMTVLLLLITTAGLPSNTALACCASEDDAPDTTETARRSASEAEYQSRLLFGGTATPMEQGAVEVSAVAFALPQVAVGITPAVSVEAGLSVAPGHFGDVYLANPKIQLWSSGPWHVALDVRTVLAERAVGTIGQRETRWEIGAVPQVTGTVGGDQASVTLGVGIPWNTMGFRLDDPADAFGKEAALRITGGADFQIRSWMTLLSENHLYAGVTEKTAINSPLRSAQSETVFESLNGVRLHEAGLALDAAVGVDTDGDLISNDLSTLFPYLRLSYRF